VNIASFGARTTPFLFRRGRSGGQLDVQVGWVYDIKADSYSCRHAWDRYDAEPPAQYAGCSGRRSRSHCATDEDRPSDQVKFVLTMIKTTWQAWVDR